MSQPADRYFLVADIGGTNTRVALSDGTDVLASTIRRYRNAEHAGLDTVLRAYMDAECDVVPRAVCVDVAGPVRDGRARLTNLDWDISIESIAAATSAKRVAVLNDLQAMGYALDQIAPEDLAMVRRGSPAGPDATKLVVNIGTGFNATPVFKTGTGWLVATSESGHVNMPTRTEADFRLCRYVEQHYGFAAVDDILSGRGVVRIYNWLSHEAGEEQSPTSAEIMENCRTAADPRAVETVRTFTRLLAMVTGNLALVQLPFGGIYLVGGLAPAILPYMDAFGFDEAFCDKGRFSEFMTGFPVHVVQDDYAALKGAATYLQGFVNS
jgi:glucokinase